ncbi:MAG: flagellar basal body rod protein FlgB [Enterococcus aquimarinus]|uniref:Flagellar basal body rod protein FlgB n=1 Tax=Enterococcus aquimarinus TaxID=328396 RepID=A0A9E4DSL7_9ENTE|nr:flagellar basal body rod protein FlgB [Enterococcus aquimarinus]
MVTYDLLKTALNVSATRGNLISSNIANVNTPNYKAQRVEFEADLKKAMDGSQFTLRTTNANHLGGANNIQPRIVENSQNSVKENGNSVDLDIEMVDQATNGLYYQALTAQVNGRLKMMNYVTSN